MSRKHDHLYPRQALIVCLIWFGYSYREIAELLGSNLGAVASNVQDACERAGLPCQNKILLLCWWLKTEGIYA